MTRLALVPLLTLLSVQSSNTPLAVWSAGAVEEGVVRLAAEYRRTASHEVTASFGTGPELQKRLSSDASADVLIAPAAVVQRAVKSGRVVPGTETPVGRVGVGVTVRRGAAPPDVGTVDALKDALLGADSVVYNQASTGQYLETLFTKLGIADQIKGKTTRYGNAAQVLEHVIAGTGREIGFGPLTEIKSFEPKGVVLVAPLPADVQNYTTYVAAVLHGTRTGDAAKDFIRYLTTPAARQAFAATGVQ
jgi:molybdate transport system substrate-binding protein